MSATRTESVRQLMADNLRATLEDLYAAYNAHPSKAGRRYIEAVKKELGELV